MKFRLRSLSVLVVLSIIGLQTSILHSHSTPQSKLIEGAKKESRFIWYTSMAIDLSRPLLDAFTKEYPFAKGELVRAGNEQITNRILNETRAGKWAFDLLSISSAELFVDRGLLAPSFDQGRQRGLPAIIEAFFTLAQESRQKVTAGVITSVPLSEDQIQRLEKELSRASKKQVFLKPMVDESILGGVIVKIENKIIDGSVKHRLEKIKQEMLKTY